MLRESKLKLASRPVPCASRLTLIAGLFWVAKQVRQGVRGGGETVTALKLRPLVTSWISSGTEIDW